MESQTIDHGDRVVQLEGRRHAELGFEDRLRRLELGLAELVHALCRQIDLGTDDRARILEIENSIGCLRKERSR